MYHTLIHFQEPREEARGAPGAGGPGPGGPPHRLPCRGGEGGPSPERVREGRAIEGVEEEARLPVLDELGDAAPDRPEDRPARGERGEADCGAVRHPPAG